MPRGAAPASCRPALLAGWGPFLPWPGTSPRRCGAGGAITGARVTVWTYEASPVAWAHKTGRAFADVIIGPVGSGKSVPSLQRILDIASQQEPSPDGVRLRSGRSLNTRSRAKGRFPPQRPGSPRSASAPGGFAVG